MRAVTKHWPRIAVTLLPLLFALLHSFGLPRLGVLQRLDEIVYDARLRARQAATVDERVVIVDIDEKSLAEYGRWPWSRNQLAKLIDELVDRQQIAVVGFDMVFAEPDTSSGLSRLHELARHELRDQPGFAERVRELEPALDYDATFARSLQKRPVVLGYYFNQEAKSSVSGMLPASVFGTEALQGAGHDIVSWNSYGANLPVFTKNAAAAGFFSMIPDNDGVARSLPLVAEFQGQYYESLVLAMYRQLSAAVAVTPVVSEDFSRSLHHLKLSRADGGVRNIRVDEHGATLVPYRGKGGPEGGSYRYIPAADLIAGRIPARSLSGKIVLVGTSALGLLDLRVTPEGESYPGVEAHANLISGLLDNRMLEKPDYARGYEALTLLISGLLLAFCLPLLSAKRALLLNLAVVSLLIGLNSWMFYGYGLVLPLASGVTMCLLAFGLNMSYGYLVESRSKRELAQLFGTYVPPELVDEMVKDPDAYSMQATNRQLTVMFCDMRGFTKMSETMQPIQLQALLTGVFSRLTQHIRAHKGTIDKYMGDCVMAFWGAPVETPEHASLGVRSALEMVTAMQQINQQHRQQGLPEIGIGIGLNTGEMCVGDMGSNIRRAYTVIGDAVNLGSRLEGLCKVYGVELLASETTYAAAPDYAWQELDRVRVKGKEQAVTIYQPLCLRSEITPELSRELKAWAEFLRTYRAQNWEEAEVQLLQLTQGCPEKALYRVYAERLATMRLLPFDAGWDGATHFETK